MDNQTARDLMNCLCCSNDVEALEYYLTEHDEGKEIGEFSSFADGDRIIYIIENILPMHFTLSEKTMIGHIMAKEGETLEQINRRNIKFIIVNLDEDEDLEAEEGWNLVEVIIPQGSLCYCFSDPEYYTTNVFTKVQLQHVQ